MAKDKSIIGIGIAALVVFGCMTVYALNTRQVPANELKNAPTTAAKPQTLGDKVSVARPKYDKGDITYPMEEKTVPDGQDKYTFALTSFMQGVSAIPKDAKVKSVSVADGLATVDFNQSFQHGYSTDDESQIVNGILTTLGQFQGVSKVRFLVEGKPIETLGQSDLSAPLDVIRASDSVAQKP